EASIPSYQQDNYISRGNLRGHPLEDLEHLGVVIENVSGPVRTVEVQRQSGITVPRRNVRTRLPVGDLECLLHMGKVRAACSFHGAGMSCAPDRTLQLGTFDPARLLVDQLDAIAL